MSVGISGSFGKKVEGDNNIIGKAIAANMLQVGGVVKKGGKKR